MLSRDNIQRVRRDEAAAKAEQEEKQQRAEIAVSSYCSTSPQQNLISLFQEREAQLTFMRKRAREREGITAESESSHTAESSASASSYTEKADKHINFFSDIQQGVRLTIPLWWFVFMLCTGRSAIDKQRSRSGS